MSSVLNVKHNIRTACSTYYECGCPVATWDGGPCELWFEDGKKWSFSVWTPDWLDTPVYPRGEAKIALIMNYNYVAVEDEASAELTFTSFDGETTYYKSQGLELVAHSEKPYDSRPELIIVEDTKYEVVRIKDSFRKSVFELFLDGHPIASVKKGLLSAKAVFENGLSLEEKVAITLLCLMLVVPEEVENKVDDSSNKEKNLELLTNGWDEYTTDDLLKMISAPHSKDGRLTPSPPDEIKEVITAILNKRGLSQSEVSRRVEGIEKESEVIN